MKSFSIKKFKEYVPSHTVHECVKEFGYCKQYIYMLCKKYNVKVVRDTSKAGKPKSEITKKRNEEMIECYKNNNITMRELGKKFGVSFQYVSLVLIENNVKTHGELRETEIVNYCRNNEFTISELVDKYKMSGYGVRSILTKHNLLKNRKNN